MVFRRMWVFFIYGVIWCVGLVRVNSVVVGYLFCGMFVRFCVVLVVVG